MFTTQTSRRLKRVIEGVALWLAMLLLLFVQPIYADASESAGELIAIELPERVTALDLMFSVAVGLPRRRGRV